MMKPLRSTFLAWLPMFFLLSSCSGLQKPAEQIPLGLIAALTGDIALPGQQTQQGAELAVQEINRSGGIDVKGRKMKVSLIVEDNENSQETAVSKAFKLINRDRVVTILGLPFSQNAIPVSKVAEENRVPMISTQSTNPQTTLHKRYVFRMAYLDAFQGKVMADFALKELGARKAAVLFDAADIYAAGISRFFREAFEQGEGQVVAYEAYTKDEPDVLRRILKIKQAQADVLFVPGYSQHMKTLMLRAYETGIPATFLGADSWSIFPVEGYPIPATAYFSEIWSDTSTEERSRQFVKTFQETYGMRAMNSAALAYDAVYLLAEAIHSRGAADPEAIREGIASISGFEGVTGSVRFEGSGDPVRSAVIVCVKKGEPSKVVRRMNP